MPAIVLVPNAAEIQNRAALYQTVDAVQAGPPYHDASGTILAKDWLDQTLAASPFILLCPEGAAHLGYCFAQPYETYSDLLHPPETYGVTARSCLYLSELGVVARARGQRIGSALVQELITLMPSEFDTILVRTMQYVFPTTRENPAIAFYERQGFELVGGRNSPWVEHDGRFRERPRVFMRYRR
ncbi:MAG: GNAT family N-acetyltransferase [Pseudomonadota bacterium]